MPGVSIIIPYYNDRKRIQFCIDSVADAVKTSGVAAEILVIDDCSPVNLNDINPLPYLKVIRLTENSGVGTARNAGAEMAVYEHLLFVDSDVMLDVRHLLIIFNRLQKGEIIKVLQGPTSSIPLNKKNRLFASFLAVSWNYYEHLNRSVTFFSQCVFISKDYFFSIGKFNEKYKGSGGEEFEIALRIMQDDANAIQFDERIVHYHHFDGFTKRMKKVFFRGHNVSETLWKIPSLPVRFRIETILRILFSFFLPLSLILLFFIPFHAIFLYLSSGILLYYLDGRFSAFIKKEKSVLMSVLSVPFRQAEYFFAFLGLVNGYASSQFRIL